MKHKAKQNKVSKEHGTYQAASTIGILYNMDEFGTEAIHELATLLKTDGKNVALQGYTNQHTEEPMSFSKKDISNTGTIKKDSLAFFVKQPFDFLLSLDTTENVNYRYILALSKAICKIGFETEHYYDVLQLSLKVDENQSNSIANMVRYLKMIG